MFHRMIHDWFAMARPDYNDFIKAMFAGDVDAMNEYMNRVALQTFSYFDTGDRASGAEPERFYHGFVLGLIVDLEDRYQITSNLESGFGRYDVVVESKEKADPAIIMEFKIQDQDEKDLPQTVEVALSQIETKNYASVLTGKGMQPEGNRKYVFAFRGKENKNQRNERI